MCKYSFCITGGLDLNNMTQNLMPTTQSSPIVDQPKVQTEQQSTEAKTVEHGNFKKSHLLDGFFC